MVPSLNSPTAQMLLAEEAATANNWELAPGAGLGTTVQAEPSQCRSSVCVPPLPTAQVSLADVPATPTRSFETGGHRGRQ